METRVVKHEVKQVKEKAHQTEIFEYIRRRKGGKTHKVGVVFGTDIDGVIRVGWSKCNFKAGDKFDIVDGIKLAKARVLKSANITIPATPNCIRRQVRQFGARCVRYFKNATKLELPA